jgi:hypothetical protein
MQQVHPTNPPRSRRARSFAGRRAALAVATSALLSLAATACGSDSVLGPGVGTGNVSASGAVTTSGSGLALFQSISSGGSSLFQVVVVPVNVGQSTTPAWQLQIANYSGRPEVGTYSLTPLSASSTNPTANFYYTSGSAIDSYNSVSGELVITSSSPSAVRGTFTFVATNVAGGSASVTVSGSFNAPCAPGIACQ